MRKLLYRLGILAIGFSLGITACDTPTEPDPDPDPNGIQPTLTSIQQNVFSPTCAVAGCHAGPQGEEGLVLAAGQSHGNLVNVASNQVPDLTRVAPGDPENSYLIIKLEGSGRMASGTMRMPAGGAPLSQEAMNAIRQWISQGAQNN